MSPSANEPTSTPTLRQIPRRYVALGLIVVAIFLLGALVIVRDNSTPGSSSTVETLSPAPDSLLSSLATVPPAVYNAVGVSSPTNPVTTLAATGSTPVWQATVNGGPPEPVLFFYGSEFAPYAAAERWPVVLALSRFGTFDQLGLMQSSPTTAFSDLSTFTFWKVGYSSKYLILQSVERYSSLNPTGARYASLERPDGRQSAAIASYGSSNTAPLVDVGNHWVLSGSSYSPAVLDGMSQSEVAGTLSNPLSPMTQAMVASANEISAAICSVDGQLPGAVCESHGVEEADAKLGITPPA
jgi:hypothetical protein